MMVWMRRAGIAFVVLVIAGSSAAMLLAWVLPRTASWSADATVSVSSLLVTAATLASVSFGVISYLESTVFQRHVDEAKASILSSHSAAREEIHALRVVTHDVGRAAIEGLTMVFMQMPAGPQFQQVMAQLAEAKLKVDLALASENSLMEASQAAFKASKTRFLEIESIIWERSNELPRESRDRVRAQFRSLKQIALDMIKRRQSSVQEEAG